MIKSYLHKNRLLTVLMLIVSLFLTGCSTGDNVTGAKDTKMQQMLPTNSGQSQNTETAQPGTAGKAETVKVTVYHAAPDALHLVPEVHVVPKPAQPAQTALELLLAGTNNKDLYAAVPGGTKLRSVTIKNHIAYADFSEAIAKNASGSATELLLVGAIVNTLTELADIQKVQILVGGKKIGTLSGHVDISQPLSRMEQLIKKGA